MTIRKQITSSFSAAVVFLWAWLLPFRASAQSLSLNDAIRIAQENSYSAQVARFSFMASYWTYRSFKAELLPSVNLNGGLMNFDHSLVSTRNYEDGRLAYVDNNTLSNNLALSLDQRIAATGGTVSLRSYLYRLDHFTYKEKTYNSQPLHISYSQPLRAFNQLKWDKKTAPVEYEIAQKTYISNMQTIALNVTTLFFNALTAQSNYQQSQSNVEDRERLYGIAKQRLDLGTVTKSDVLQMELSLLNARVARNKNRIRLDDAMYDLFSYLRVTEYDEAELLPPFDVPDMLLELEEVIEKAIANSAHTREQKLAMLNAEKELVKAKANQGLQVSLNGQLGFMQTDFMGNVSNSDVIDFYRKTPVDLFVNVSDTEGLPVSIMEAISFGIPVLATDVGGVSEIVKINFNGELLHVDFSDGDFASAIKMYYQSGEEKKKTRRQNARLYWEQNFNAEKN